MKSSTIYLIASIMCFIMAAIFIITIVFAGGSIPFIACGIMCSAKYESEKQCNN